MIVATQLTEAIPPEAVEEGVAWSQMLREMFSDLTSGDKIGHTVAVVVLTIIVSRMWRLRTWKFWKKG